MPSTTFFTITIPHRLIILLVVPPCFLPHILGYRSTLDSSLSVSITPSIHKSSKLPSIDYPSLRHQRPRNIITTLCHLPVRLHESITVVPDYLGVSTSYSCSRIPFHLMIPLVQWSLPAIKSPRTTFPLLTTLFSLLLSILRYTPSTGPS